jgi:hypothetical protein
LLPSPSSSSSLFATLQLNYSATKKEAFFFFFFAAEEKEEEP